MLRCATGYRGRIFVISLLLRQLAYYFKISKPKHAQIWKNPGAKDAAYK
jgi:hypothetical protein